MSYLRMSHPLQWFNDCSTEYIFERGEGAIEDYGTSFEHLPSLIEMVGHMVLNETKDFEFATKVVVALAVRSGIKHKLRLTKPHEYDEIEKSARGRDYMGSMQRWVKFFDIATKYSSFHTNIDEIDDFEYLDTFTEEELFDVQKHLNGILDEITTSVRGVVGNMDLPCEIDIESNVYRWSQSYSDEPYELGVDIKFKETFTSEMSEEENEIKKVEDAIYNSKVLEEIEKRLGLKIEVSCYIPFDISDIPPKG
jgi:hypothetical protein